MNQEQRQQQYIQLLQMVLDDPQNTNEILLSQEEILDQDFLKLMVSVAVEAQENGRDDLAEFLVDLGQQLGEALGIDITPSLMESRENPDYGAFLQEVLTVALQNYGQMGVTFPVLAKYQQLLDENFGRLICNRLIETCQANPEAKDSLIGLVENLMVDISDFPLGRRWDNLEIAIMGYQTVL
ncbi:MAG: hypothetical protein HC799_01195 [Limnothrix sp. RL_2_0]|nr:hypothetical protein [Limnothrix sp. RL_2_0]